MALDACPRYFSPYPLTESEADELAVTPGSTASQPVKIPGVHKVTARSHGRTSDLLAGGLGRAHAGERSMLWVCEMCFKYMADCNSYELHIVGFLLLFYPFLYFDGHPEIMQRETSAREKGLSTWGAHNMGS
jgi:hypothetical protein